MSKAPAFTLIETLIALVIVVGVLGSATAANRVTQTGTARIAEQVQMSSLAADSLDAVEGYQDSLRRQTPSATLGGSLFLGLPTAQSQTVVGTFYPVSVALPGLCSGLSACVSPESSGPLKLEWCSFSGGAAVFSCNPLLRSPIFLGGGTSAKSVYDTSGNVPLAGTGQGDFIAVKKIADDAASAVVVDIQRPLPGSASLNPLGSDAESWNFYKRTLSISRYAESGAGSLAFSSRSPAGAAALSASTYLVTAEITSLAQPGVKVRRTRILTDWYQ